MRSYYKNDWNKRSHDIANATFIWRIYLDPTYFYEGKMQSLDVITGCTKKVNIAEKKDKTALLINRLRSILIRHEYLQRSRKITVHLNRHMLKDLDLGEVHYETGKDLLLFTLLPKECKFTGRFWRQKVFHPDDVIYFIKKEIYASIGEKAITQGNGKFLDINNFNFFSEGDMIQQIVDLCYEGYPKGQIKQLISDYYQQRKDANFNRRGTAPRTPRR